MILNALAPQTQVWFDHSWGGGTDVYTKIQFDKLKSNTLCIRAQYYASTDSMHLSIVYKDFRMCGEFFSDDYFVLLKHLRITKIVLNNIAGYKNINYLFQKIDKLKKKTQASVSFRLHDYQCLCPKITMTNSLGVYCHCENLKHCENCLAQSENVSIRYSSLTQYQDGWKMFLHDIADEIIAFSQSSKDILCRLYPRLSNKICIIPHTIKPLRAVRIEPHTDINIGILGAISVEKGLNILEQTEDLLKAKPNIHMTVIGITAHPLSKIKITGKYNPEELPDIMEKNRIDIVYIPSVWPETFSYTTSEAMSMGLPVACFNIGAPAERVKNYEKGLVIDEIDAHTAFEKIVAFIIQNRNAEHT
jgi:glycosyltransferase involved in cell wall biosynthesis